MSEEEHPDDFAAHRRRQLFKRETFFEEKKSEHFQEQQLVLVYESSASGINLFGVKETLNQHQIKKNTFIIGLVFILFTLDPQFVRMSKKY